MDPRQRETETEREKDREQIFLKFLCVSTIYQTVILIKKNFQVYSVQDQDDNTTLI